MGWIFGNKHVSYNIKPVICFISENDDEMEIHNILPDGYCVMIF